MKIRTATTIAIVFVLTLVLAITFSYNYGRSKAIATTQIATSQSNWNVETMKKSKEYSQSYSMKQCFIYVYRDGSGIEISATNPDFLDSSKKPVFQTIIIKKDKDGVVHFDDGVDRKAHV